MYVYKYIHIHIYVYLYIYTHFNCYHNSNSFGMIGVYWHTIDDRNPAWFRLPK